MTLLEQYMSIGRTIVSLSSKVKIVLSCTIIMVKPNFVYFKHGQGSLLMIINETKAQSTRVLYQEQKELRENRS